VTKLCSIKISFHHLLTLEKTKLLSLRKASLSLSQDKYFRSHIEKGAKFLRETLSKEGYLYGITTGYGDNCVRPVPLDLVEELPLQLTRFHGCGLGAFLSIPQTRVVLAVRLMSLCRGLSGVTFQLLERLEMLIQKDILPLIPSEGSVGASGDLTPLSYVAAVIVGEREVWYEGQRRQTSEVYQELGILPYQLRPKEALALMNGTSVMTALATESYHRAHYLSRLSARLTAMTSLSLKGNPHHFHEALFAAKPHPGQARIAAYIRADLQKVPPHFPDGRLQDRYSTRCAPHVIGVLEDLLPTFQNIIETEINSANDNPLIKVGENPEEGLILNGGNFYGGHIAFVMDGLKILVANIADLLDRQMATLVDPKFNNGLAPNHSGVEGHRACINHGLKALQIGASAWTAEALKNTMPASVFSRSTESHNQDKVSMGTIAARDALRILELTEQVAAAQMIATLQGLRLREREGVLTRENYPPPLRLFIESLEEDIPFIAEDQPLDSVLRTIVSKIQHQAWALYGEDE
jgi:histidine ammonia-lyase